MSIASAIDGLSARVCAAYEACAEMSSTCDILPKNTANLPDYIRLIPKSKKQFPNVETRLNPDDFDFVIRWNGKTKPEAEGVDQFGNVYRRWTDVLDMHKLSCQASATPDNPSRFLLSGWNVLSDEFDKKDGWFRPIVNYNGYEGANAVSNMNAAFIDCTFDLAENTGVTRVNGNCRLSFYDCSFSDNCIWAVLTGSSTDLASIEYVGCDLDDKVGHLAQGSSGFGNVSFKYCRHRLPVRLGSLSGAGKSFEYVPGPIDIDDVIQPEISYVYYFKRISEVIFPRTYLCKIGTARSDNVVKNGETVYDGRLYDKQVNPRTENKTLIDVLRVAGEEFVQCVDSLAEDDLRYNSYSVIKEIGIAYDANGGDGPVPSDDVRLVLLRSEFTAKPGTGLTKGGNAFACWNTAADGSGTDIMPGETYTYKWWSTGGAFRLFAKYA